MVLLEEALKVELVVVHKQVIEVATVELVIRLVVGLVVSRSRFKCTLALTITTKNSFSCIPNSATVVLSSRSVPFLNNFY